jgi:hypothetical protein
MRFVLHGAADEVVHRAEREDVVVGRGHVDGEFLDPYVRLAFLALRQAAAGGHADLAGEEEPGSGGEGAGEDAG